MKTKLSLLFTAMFLGACAQEPVSIIDVKNTVTANQSLFVVQAIPKPSDMIADVITNARVSKIKHIDVTYVGKQIPFTFSHGKVKKYGRF